MRDPQEKLPEESVGTLTDDSMKLYYIGESTLVQGMNKREKGTVYETLACRLLTGEGYRILERNFRSGRAEIDIVAREGKYLVFVEVKARASRSCGYGAEAVNFRKQERICSAARYYMYRHHISPSVPVRFDVVSVDGGRARLVRNAFGYSSAQGAAFFG